LQYSATYHVPEELLRDTWYINIGH
jgi:hypothetical protein